MLLEGFYGTGPVIGILTTGEDWRISWFHSDHEELLNHNMTQEKDYFTPPEQGETATIGSTGNSPSQQTGELHQIETEDLSESNVDETEITPELERFFYTTKVININKEYSSVLQHLCSAFQLMTNAKTQHNRSNKSFIVFHKELQFVTLHTPPPDSYSKLNLSRFPSSNTTKLLALEDLGRGATGKAWFCVTLSSQSASVCVLKFHNSNKSLVNEKAMWHTIYPEFQNMVKIENWSGFEALVMPHFSTVLEHEREQYCSKIRETLAKFEQMRKVHSDVKWNNIGKYEKNGEVTIVIYDLHDVEDYNPLIHVDWIDIAVEKLYNNVQLVGSCTSSYE